MQPIPTVSGILPVASPPLPATAKEGFDAALAAAQTSPALLGSRVPAGPSSAALTKLSGETQRLIDLGNAISRSGPAFSPVSLSGQAVGGLPGAPIIDLTALNRAYDFAMRSYLLSKVASEVSGGLRSLWQAQ